MKPETSERKLYQSELETAQRQMRAASTAMRSADQAREQTERHMQVVADLKVLLEKVKI